MNKLIFSILAAVCASTSVNATSIVQHNMAEITDNSSFVFQGKVTGLNSYQEANGAIFTIVEFDVQDVVKGTHPSDTVTLRYLGGSANGLTMNVIDSDVPKYGQTGIFFVAKNHHKLAHPLAGWGQGHYILESTANGYKVFNSRGKAVTGLDAGKSATVIRHALSSHESSLSSHEARGVYVSDKSRNAITPQIFKDKIRSLINQ